MLLSRFAFPRAVSRQPQLLLSAFPGTTTVRGAGSSDDDIHPSKTRIRWKYVKKWKFGPNPFPPLPTRRADPEEEKTYATNDMAIPRNRREPGQRFPHYYRRRYPVEVSMRYMESDAYKEIYGDYKIWQLYRRRPKNTPAWVDKPSKSCVDDFGVFVPSNPCPICRDEYLTVDYRNVKLLEQFINPETGDLYPVLRVGVCLEMFIQLGAHICKAKDHGLITYKVPFRNYDYRDYYPSYTKPPGEPIPEDLIWPKIPLSVPDPHHIYVSWNPEQGMAGASLSESYDRIVNPPSGCKDPVPDQFTYSTQERFEWYEWPGHL